jgi:hypothetical protein
MWKAQILHCGIVDLVGSRDRRHSRLSRWNIDVRAAESIRIECIFFVGEHRKIRTVKIATDTALGWQYH